MLELHEQRLTAIRRTTMLLVVAWTLAALSGCSAFPSANKLDLMSPKASLFFPGQKKGSSNYRFVDGTAPQFPGGNAMTMETYQKIREARNQNAVVLQVAGDSEPVRVLPLPSGNQSAFVSELLSQTGVKKKLGSINATVYRPAPESITGVRMEVQFNDEGEIDPTTDYALRPGDRVHITPRVSSGVQSLMDSVLRR